MDNKLSGHQILKNMLLLIFLSIYVGKEILFRDAGKTERKIRKEFSTARKAANSSCLVGSREQGKNRGKKGKHIPLLLDIG